MIFFEHCLARLDDRNMIDTPAVSTPLNRTSGDMACHADFNTESTTWPAHLHIGRCAPTLGRGVRLVTNWWRDALHHGWSVASDTTSGANRICADLSRNACRFVTLG